MQKESGEWGKGVKSKNGVTSLKMHPFNPTGANSSLYENTSFWEDFILHISKQEVSKLPPFGNMAEKDGSVSIHLN